MCNSNAFVYVSVTLSIKLQLLLKQLFFRRPLTLHEKMVQRKQEEEQAQKEINRQKEIVRSQQDRNYCNWMLLFLFLSLFQFSSVCVY